MMNSVNGMMPAAMMPQMSQVQEEAMTDEQTEGLDALLSDYDLEDLSDDDASSIVSGISDLGIAPTEELAAVLSEYGVDAKGLAEQAGTRPPPPPPPADTETEDDTSGVDEAALEVLTSVLEELSASEETDETDEVEDTSAETLKDLLALRLEEAGLASDTKIVDLRL